MIPDSFPPELRTLINSLYQTRSPETSNVVEKTAKHHAASLLIKKDHIGYINFLKEYNSLKLPDYRPNFITLMAKWEGRKEDYVIPLHLCSYLSSFKGDRFANHSYLTEYLKNDFISRKLKYKDEFETGSGRCDFFIFPPHSILLELKPAKITWKDIFQCVEYKHCDDGAYPVVLLGHEIDQVMVNRANEYGIDVYLYKVISTTPTQIKTKHIIGNQHVLFKRRWTSQFLNEYGRIIKECGWTGS